MKYLVYLYQLDQAGDSSVFHFVMNNLLQNEHFKLSII